ncbi:polysaccharide lyase family 7 protein [Pseudonocardia sp. TRM90224]|uniref:polysaccharide lyase family 7 protein n=1 Tax=Pseudonocardia sp. TRM90224 TaxID=2812678 RepID=UPI001E403994|nr:polysaccharide lyase family 7 protein [Pseudonocardia sp. TRM90224]
MTLSNLVLAALTAAATVAPVAGVSGALPPVPPVPAPPVVAQPTVPVRPAVEHPSDLLDLSNWKLTLPEGEEGKPREVMPPGLPEFSNEFFRLTDKGDAVLFTAEVGGVTTKNSSYPRSELREMQGDENASWSNTTGRHVLNVREAILAVPTAKPEIVAAQIHDGDDDVLQIRLEGERLMVQYDDGESETLLDPAYKLGTPFDISIIAADSRVEVIYNGTKKAELDKSGTGWYFKVGAYVQSSPDKGDEVGTPGTVAVYSLELSHTEGSAQPGRQ